MSYSCFSDYYDRLTENVNYNAIAAYIKNLLDRYGCTPEYILDAACGTGSLAVILADMGYDMVCCDQSAEMLSVAMQKAEGRNILFLNQSMQKLDLYGTVGCTVCTLDSVNHITDEKKLAVGFRRISLFTEPGGLFIFDVNTPYKHKSVLANNTFVYETEKVMCVWQNTTNMQNLLTQIDLDFFENTENNMYIRRHESFAEKGYELSYLTDLLKNSDFELLDIFEENSFNPPGEKCQRAVFVARKI